MSTVLQMHSSTCPSPVSPPFFLQRFHQLLQYRVQTMSTLFLPLVHDLPRFQTCTLISENFITIPDIDLENPDAKRQIVEACEEFGFFKVVNHGISMELLRDLENGAVEFFQMPEMEKERAGPCNPFGYGNKKVGPNGDVGWLEYLFLYASPEIVEQSGKEAFTGISESLRCLVREYVRQVRHMASRVLEMIADELGLWPRTTFSKLITDPKSDSWFRVNHYPSCSELHPHLNGQNLIGLGEHTDPQVISVVRSNDISGLQIRLRDGAWVTVPADHNAFYFNVGDCLQVMTNGRFRSVMHRVLADRVRFRLSMVFFGGPPLDAKIVPMGAVMEEGEESLYEEFTWAEFKNNMYKTKLSQNRLEFCQKLG